MDNRIKLAAAAAFYLLALAAQLSGYTNPGVALLLAVIATLLLIAPCYHHTRKWHLQRKALGNGALGTPQIVLLGGLAGTWLFMTIALGAAAWGVINYSPTQTPTVTTPQVQVPIPAPTAAQQENGPLVWFSNLTMEGGPPANLNVFSIRFKGTNASQREVKLKNASLISAVNGTKITLEIAALNEIVAVDQIELIPAGSPIELIAKFGPADPNNPGKILGLEPKQFLETWRQFSFNAEDDTRTYRIPFNEGNLAPFFPNMVGPHVTKKVRSP